MIKIVTDSASGIGKELAKKLGVIVVDIPVIIDGIVYDDKQPINFGTVLRYMQGDKEVSTSQITPQTYKDLFEEIINNGDEVLCIAVSSKLSGTFNSALLAKSMLDGHEEKIAVVDSLNALIGQSLLVEDATVMIKEGKNLADIVQAVEINKRKVKQYIVVDTLDYLYKRGRLSKVQYTVANILKMKIVLKAEEGEIIVETKERGTKKIMKWLEDKYVFDRDNIDFSKPLALCYREDEEVELNENVFNDIRENNHIKVDISTILLLFTGETAVGIGYFEK